MEKWWTEKFRSELEHRLQKTDPPLPSPVDTALKRGKMHFERGVEEGIKIIDTKLSDFNWMLMKSKYKNYVSKYGGDANLDWMNFKIHLKYIKLCAKGKDQNEALETTQDYVKKDLHLQE